MIPTLYSVIVLPTAFADLDRITNYIREFSPQNAAGVLERLSAAAQSLSTFPTRYEVHQVRKDHALTVRSMAVPPWIVYHRIDDTHRVVRILTIRDGRRRQPKRFR